MVEVNFKSVALPLVAGAFLISRFVSRSTDSASQSTDGTSSDKPVFGSGKMFDKFAHYYDMGNRFMSLGQDQSWRTGLLAEAEIQKTDNVLDLATGSADVAISASASFHAKSVIGLDPSVEMLKVGRSKVDALSITNIDLIEGDAQAMPQFQDGEFDKITMSFGIRNVPDRLKALKEMRRVIAAADSSRLAIMEFSAPPVGTILGNVARWFVRHVVPLIGGLITSATEEYRYLEESIFQFPSPAEFEGLIESAGFEVVRTVSYAAGVVNVYIAKPKL